MKNVKIWVPILDKRRSSCYYKKTERTLFFINDRKEVQYAKSIFIIGRGYSIDSITAGVTADPRFTRITIVASGDELILSQIEKQVRKLEDVIEIKVLQPEDSVYRELIMVKVRANKTERTEIISVADIFRAKIVDVEKDSLMVELTGNGSKVDAFLELLEGYEILELARTGITGLQRGIKDVTVIDQEGNINTL